MKKNKKILVVEDENIIAVDIKRALQKYRYDVSSIVSTGIDAIEKVGTDKPDLILMDIMLKGSLSGIDTAKIIKEKNDIPLIYLTALADDITLQNAKVTEPFGYVLKPFDERNLFSTIEMALYKHKIEKELKQRTKELEEEKKKTERLLHNILPDSIVKELRQKGVIEPKYYENSSILFADFEGFKDVIPKLSPEILLEELDEIFYEFDAIIEDFELEKLKTIGDIYMVGAGFPKENNNHGYNTVLAAVKMQDYIIKRNKKLGMKCGLRIGINSGPVVAGIVGSNKFCYDVWGNTVNIADRLKKNCSLGKINISQTTYNLVKDYFNCEYGGKINANGHGSVEMYYVQKANDEISLPYSYNFISS